MPARRRVALTEGLAALGAYREAGLDPAGMPRAVVATAVRYCLEEFAAQHPGRSVELRVPPHGAVQCIEGPNHKRGTPPNVFETDAATWLALATGGTTWLQAVDTGAIRASGLRADLSHLLPVVGL